MKKVMNSKNLFLLLLLIPFFGISQVDIINIPLDNQLVPRSISSNTGEFKVDGSIDLDQVDYDALRITVTKLQNGNISEYSFQEKSLTGNSGVVDFSFNIEIDAVLANYSVELFGLKNNVSTAIPLPAGTGKNIVAGDVYVIQGQSNAEAQLYEGSSNDLKNNFIRVFANGTNNSLALEQNPNWYIGEGDVTNYTNGNTGQWGMKLARSIIDEQQIPVAIFNAASPGKPIEYFKKDYLEVNQSRNNYQRLLYRLSVSGLKDAVRGIFWSQGESDVKTPLQFYVSAFEKLKQNWSSDFTKLEDIYIFQTKSACSTPNLMHIKEAQ